MNFRDWAESLLAARPEPADMDWRIADAAVALVAGAGTTEGKSLYAFYGEDVRSATRQAALHAALIRLTECDDIHLPSCVTPGSATIPIAFALTAEKGMTARSRMVPAIAAGYSAGMRLGAAVGGAKALAVGVWPSLLCAPLMAAVTASIVSGHDVDELAHAMALSLAGRSGRLGRPSGGSSARWFAFAEAVASGIRASQAAREGFRGDLGLISDQWLSAASASELVDPAALDLRVTGPSTTEVCFKPFVTARQGANAIVAFQRALAKTSDPRDIEHVLVSVPPVYAAMLSRPVVPGDRLSTLTNVGFQCACAVLAPELLYDVERASQPQPHLLQFASRVEVRSAPDLAAHYPDAWPARLEITAGGRTIQEEVIRIAGDAGEEDAREILVEKFKHLAAPYPGFAPAALAMLEPGAADRRLEFWNLACEIAAQTGQPSGALHRAARG